MTDFVGGCITDGFAHHVVVEYLATYSWVYRSCLYETPVVEQRNDVVVPNDVTGKDFARTRVHMAGSHGVGCGCCSVFEATVTHVVRVEVRVVFRIIHSFDGVFETGGLESCIPVFYSLMDGRAPLFGESGIYVEHDGFLRFHQFALEVFVQILFLRFQTPTMDECAPDEAVLFRSVYALVGVEKTYAIVLQAHRHRVVRQCEERTVHDDRVRLAERGEGE